jgi:hypothetical protein
MATACSSTPSQDDPTQELISLVIANIGYHDYQNAKTILNSSPHARPQMTYFVERGGRSNKFDKVTYSLSDLNLYLDDLIDAKKAIEQGCGIRKDDDSKTEASLALADLETLYKEKEYYARCVSKRGSDGKIERAFTDAHEAINRHRGEYFSQKSSFDGKDSGYILGYFRVGCGDSKRALQRTTRDVFECFLKDAEEKAYQSLKVTEGPLFKAKAELKKGEKTAYQIKKEEEDADGTTILRDYCLNVRALEQVSKELSFEKKVEKKSGVIDLKKSRDLGRAQVVFEDKMKQKEAEYMKLVGRKISSSKCTGLQQ